EAAGADIAEPELAARNSLLPKGATAGQAKDSTLGSEVIGPADLRWEADAAAEAAERDDPALAAAEPAAALDAAAAEPALDTAAADPAVPAADPAAPATDPAAAPAVAAPAPA